MNVTTKMAAAAACLAVGAAPAVATADKPADPGAKGRDKAATHTTTMPGHARPQAKGQSMRCRKPTVAKAFVASGAFTSWTGVKDAPADPSSTYSGTITLTITRANHHAKNATSPIAFSKAEVTFDSPTATAPVAGERVTLIGKVVVAKRHCATQAASAIPAPGTVAIRRIAFSTRGS
jgi:hypothetical protein